MKFDDQDPNFFESEAHAVPSPHSPSSQAAKVALTTLTTAACRLSRVTKVLRTLLSAASVSPCSPLATICLMPTFVPRAKRTSRRRLRRTSGGTTLREATEANSSVKPVRKSASLRISSRSTVPQRLLTSPLQLRKVLGLLELAELGHADPRLAPAGDDPHPPPVAPAPSAESRTESAAESLPLSVTFSPTPSVDTRFIALLLFPERNPTPRVGGPADPRATRSSRRSPTTLLRQPPCAARP